MERVDAEHIQVYDDIAAGNLEGARNVLSGHIANVKITPPQALSG
ncbi:hypothetical protein [Desulfobacter curvatus]|nr:hypothetical protein [Desulfobacter curvatus]